LVVSENRTHTACFHNLTIGKNPMVNRI